MWRQRHCSVCNVKDDYTDTLELRGVRVIPVQRPTRQVIDTVYNTYMGMHGREPDLVLMPRTPHSEEAELYTRRGDGGYTLWSYGSLTERSFRSVLQTHITDLYCHYV